MGQVFYKDKYGLNQGFMIKGDEPDEAESAKINSILNGTPATPAAPAPVEDPRGIGTLLGTGIAGGYYQTKAGLAGLGSLALDHLPVQSLFYQSKDDLDKARNAAKTQSEQYAGPEGSFFDQSGLTGKSKFLAYQLGQSLPATVGGAAGAIAGSALGPGGTVGGFLAGSGLAGAASLPQNYEQNLEEQEKNHGYIKNPGKAFAGALGQSALEGLADRATLGAAGILGRAVPRTVSEVAKDAMKSAWVKAAAQVGEGALMGTATEAGTEALQQAIQRWQADESLASPEAMREYLENAVVGGLLGGVMGGTAGAVSGTMDLNERRKYDMIRKDLDAQDNVGDFVDANKKAREAQAGAEVLAEDNLSYANKPLLEDLRPSDPLISGPKTVMKNQATSPLAGGDLAGVANTMGDGQRVVNGKPSPFTEQEYTDAVTGLRGEKLISPDKIKNHLKVGRTKAQAIFDAMLERTDASKSGLTGRYLTIIDGQTSTDAAPSTEDAPKISRRYETKPIPQEDVAPYTVHIQGGRQVGPSFKTGEEAHSFAETQKLGDYAVYENPTPQQHGVYEVTSGVPGQKPVARLHKAFNSDVEARAYANGLNPNVSPQTNAITQQNTLQQRAAKRAAENLGQYQQNVQALTDKLLGPGRATADLVDSITAPNGQGLDTGTVIEGQTTIQNGLNRIKIATGITDPNLSPAEFQKAVDSIAHHEVVHVAKQSGLFTVPQWKALVNRANTRVAGKPYTYMERAMVRTQGAPSGANLQEEAIAEMFRDYMRDPTKFESAPRSLLRRMFDFIRTLGRYTSDVNNGNRVLQDFASGKIGEQPNDPNRVALYGQFYSSVPLKGFYYKAAKYFEGVAERNPKQEYPAQQWKGMLKNAQLKPEELQWLGLDKWLDEQSGKVPVGDIVQYIASNGLDIMEDPATSDAGTHKAGAMKRAAELEDKLYGIYSDARSDLSFNTWVNQMAEFSDETGRLASDLKVLRDAIMYGRDDSTNTYHDKVTKPGGTDYTELKIVMPHIGGNVPFYVSGHFNGMQNIISAARFKTRMLDGAKVLDIEEIQSDLHQQGKKKGYTSQAQLDEEDNIQQRIDQLHRMQDEIERITDYRALTPEEDQRYNELGNERVTLFERLQGMQEQIPIPDAPFKTTWRELAFKRLLRWAVDNGHDKIAWHGEPASVADTEKYGDLVEMPEDGALYTQHDINVSGVVKGYIQYLPQTIAKLMKSLKLDIKPELVKARSEPSLDPERFVKSIVPKKKDFMDAVHELTEGVYASEDPSVIDAYKMAEQVVRNQRNYDPIAALSHAGISPDDFHTDWNAMIEAANASDPEEYMKTYSITHNKDDNGNPIYDRWELPITDELKEMVLGEGMPLFSSVQKGQTNTPEFQKWFAGSVLVTQDGEPERFYTGTSKDKNFDKFNAPRNGIWFTNDPASASSYALENDSMGLKQIPGTWSYQKINTASRVIPAYISMKNPMIVDALPEEMIGQNYKKAQGAYFDKLKAQGYDGYIQNYTDDTGTHKIVVAFQPQQVKSIFNRGTYDTNDARFMYSSVQPAYSAKAPMGSRVPSTPPVDRIAEIENRITYNNIAPVIEKVLRGKGKFGLSQDKARSIAEGTIFALQDVAQPLGKLIDRVKANGGSISNETDPYLRQQLMAGQIDTTITSNQKSLYNPLIHAVQKLDVTRADLDELLKRHPSNTQVLDGVPYEKSAVRNILGNYADPKLAMAELYVYAQHATERNALMRERNRDVQGIRPEQYDSGSGMSDFEAHDVLTWIASKPFAKQFSDLSNKSSIRSLYRALIKNTNDTRINGGLIPDFSKMTDEAGNKFKTYEDYAPLRGHTEGNPDAEDDLSKQLARTGKRLNISGKEDKNALGRSSEASNLIATAILQNEEAIVRAAKNQVGQTFLRMIETNAGMALSNGPGRVADRIKDFAEVVPLTKTKPVYDQKSGVVRMASHNVSRDPDIMIVKRGGSEVGIRIQDPRLRQAMLGQTMLGDEGSKALINGLLKLNRFLAAARTSYNPEFLVSNFFRDFETAQLNMSELELKGLRTDVIKSVLPAIRGAFNGMRDTNAANPWRLEFEDFSKHGGKTAFMGTRDLGTTIERTLKELSTDPEGNWTKIKGMVGKVGELIEHQNDAVENGVRVATYKHVKDRLLALSKNPTDPKEIERIKNRAAFTAKNLTVNFNMGGSQKPLLNALYLFFNASMQGTAALVNPMIRSQKVRRLWLSAVAAGALQDIVMSLLSPIGDDGESEYDKIPDYILENNMIFMNPFTESGYIKIPMPYLFNAAWNSGRALTRGLRGGYTPGETMSSVMGTAVSTLNPWGSGGTWLNFVAPTVVDPLVDLTTNTDFTGKPIAPEKDKYSSVDLPAQRYWNNTSPAYTTVANILDRASGGDGVFKGGISYSPNQYQYAFEFLGGGAWSTVLRAWDMVAPEAVGGAGTTYKLVGGEQVSANDIPFVRRFVGNLTDKEDLQSFIAKRDQVLSVKDALHAAVKAGDSAQYQAIMQKYPKEYRLAAQISKMDSTRNKISGLIRKVQASKLPEDEKRKRVDALKKQQSAIVNAANAIMNK